MKERKNGRKEDINIEMDIEVVEHAFTLIAKFGYQASKEDIELVKNMSSTWQELRKKAMKTQEELLNVQAHFQRELIKDLGTFQVKVNDYIEDYNKHGPMQEGLDPNRHLTSSSCFKALSILCGVSMMATLLVKSYLGLTTLTNLD